MKISVLFLWAVVLSLSLQAQDPTVLKYGNQVTTADLKDYLTILASDALEGRATGTRGQKMAAAFIAFHFEELGLTAPVKGSYYQPITLYSSGTPEVKFSAGGATMKEDKYVYFGTGNSDGELQLPLVFAGYGSEADLQQVDVKGKAAIFSWNQMRLCVAILR